MRKFFTLAAVVCSSYMFASCEDDSTPPLPDNVMEFEASALGMPADQNSLEINIPFSRESEEDDILTLAVQENELVYGEDFTTDPVTENGKLKLSVPAGATKASFKILKNEEQLFDGSELLRFVIESAGENLVIGQQKELLVAFSEIIAGQAQMSPNVGGPEQPNKVFIDLSANRQTAVARNAWDLGFYTEAGEFRVILNSSTDMMARALDKTELAAVTAEDTLGFAAEMNIRAYSPEAMAFIDDPSGDLSNTAIAEINASEAENQVYIIRRGTNPDGSPRGWKKVKVLRSGDGYEIRYADIASDNYETLEVEKDEDYYFSYIHFEEGAVEVEPVKDKWDIAFTVFTNATSSGGARIPYAYKDFVLQNRFRVETAMVLEEEKGSYEEFELADLEDIELSTTQTTIGSSWRVTGGPGGAEPGVHNDRFYVVKDAAGNIYKLRFTALTQNGERGRPAIEYELLASGNN